MNEIVRRHLANQSPKAIREMLRITEGIDINQIQDEEQKRRVLKSYVDSKTAISILQKSRKSRDSRTGAAPADPDEVRELQHKIGQLYNIYEYIGTRKNRRDMLFNVPTKVGKDKQSYNHVITDTYEISGIVKEVYEELLAAYETTKPMQLRAERIKRDLRVEDVAEALGITIKKAYEMEEYNQISINYVDALDKLFCTSTLYLATLRAIEMRPTPADVCAYNWMTAHDVPVEIHRKVRPRKKEKWTTPYKKLQEIARMLGISQDDLITYRPVTYLEEKLKHVRETYGIKLQEIHTYSNGKYLKENTLQSICEAAGIGRREVEQYLNTYPTEAEEEVQQLRFDQKRLQVLRMRSNLRQKDLANILGISEAQMDRIERCYIQLTRANLHKLSRYMAKEKIPFEILKEKGGVEPDE